MRVPAGMLLLVLAGTARAADPRPDEAAMFAATEPAATATVTGTAAPPASLPREVAPENPLTIGGLLYVREASAAATRGRPSAWSLSTPILADVYGDARPDPRLRGMIRARMSYDASINPAATSFISPVPSPGPTVALDQAWVNFDIGRSVFVTAGRQHVKWGSARFWNPNDLLHTARRDALARFDARTGETMLKVHVPWEKRGWNFYAIELLESLEHADRIGAVGGAARAEFVAGTAELGVDGLAQRGFKPRAGADFSAGVWDLDVCAEGVVQRGTDRPVWQQPDGAAPGGPVVLDPTRTGKITGAAAGGLNWAFKVTDREALTLGAEYFYQGAGYTKKAVYPWLMYVGQFTPFYVARDYAAAYAFMPVPGTNNNQNVTVSNLANLSDRTGIVRIDWTAIVLTRLQVETYVAGHYGAPGGEFRFGLDLAPQVINGLPIPAVRVPSPLAEAGLGLRVNF